MKRILLKVLCCFSFSILIILTLFKFSDSRNLIGNSFTRVFPPNPLKRKQILDIKYNSYYISSVTSHYIYCGNHTLPSHLLIINTSSYDTSHLNLDLTGINIQVPAISASIDSPYVYLMDRITPAVLWCTLSDHRKIHYEKTTSDFSKCVPLSPSSYAIRKYDRQLNQYILGKIRLDAPALTNPSYVLEKQIDGRFCTDGMLQYAPDINRLIYTYYYRNEFICLDTNLVVAYKGHTIDTVSKAQIKIAEIKSEEVMTFATPPLTVNKKSCIYKDILFINSGLMADNDEKELFDTCSAIDVYSLIDGRYKYSFYLCHLKEEKLRDFRVHDNMLVALFDHYLVTYEFNMSADFN